MSIEHVRVGWMCDGCGKLLHTDMELSKMRPKGWALMDEAEDAIRGGTCIEGGHVSVQAEHHLCPKCTRLVDKSTPDTPTREQVAEALQRFVL